MEHKPDIKKGLSRKAIRKLQRQEKKVKNNAFYSKDKYFSKKFIIINIEKY